MGEGAVGGALYVPLFAQWTGSSRHGGEQYTDTGQLIVIRACTHARDQLYDCVARDVALTVLADV